MTADELAETDERATDLGPGTVHIPVDVHRHRCVVYCRRPRQYRLRWHHMRCPECYGRAVPRSIHQTDLEPVPTRLGRLAGYWMRAWADALAVLRPVRPHGQVTITVGVICKGDVFL